MFEYYDLDGIKTGLKKDIAEATAKKEAWEKVTFIAKKDGKPFAALQKNIRGASIVAESYATHTYEQKLKITAFSNPGGYVSDSLNLYETIRHMQDEEMKAKTENYSPKKALLEQAYIYDLDDIKKAIARRIEYLDGLVKSLNYQLSVADKAFSDFKAAYHQAVETLKKESGCTNNDGYETETTLFYSVLETVKKRYPYC
jgi:hypothetical protein